jgi:hypothetical protein
MTIQMNERQRIADEFNRAIQNTHNLSDRANVDWRDLISTDNIITNTCDSNSLTHLILNNYFKQDDSKEYFHFTTIESFESIVKHEKLWLFSVAKRFSENEFRPFYLAHNLHGYDLRTNSRGQTLAQEFAGDAFYTSFTNSNIQPIALKHMWEYFADKGTGVKLVFEVSDLLTDLRKVYYPPNITEIALPLLMALQNISENTFHKKLVFKQLSRIGFFYLPHDFNPENEFRILIKRMTADLLQLRIQMHSNGFEYLELPFQSSGVVNLKLKEVELIDNKNRTRAQTALSLNPNLCNIPLK